MKYEGWGMRDEGGAALRVLGVGFYMYTCHGVLQPE